MTEDFPHVVGSVDVSIKNAVIRPIIVVGVQNTERRRDLVAATVVAEEREAAPHAGGADRFRAFLRDELRPAIAARYRTSAETAIIGESLAGLFALETFVVEPTLFDAYIAVDPSVWWNGSRPPRRAEDRVGACGAAADLRRDRGLQGDAGRRRVVRDGAPGRCARGHHADDRADAAGASQHDLSDGRAARLAYDVRNRRVATIAVAS
jgi:enterochelin esterase-like enzyme